MEIVCVIGFSLFLIMFPLYHPQDQNYFPDFHPLLGLCNSPVTPGRPSAAPVIA